MCMLCKSTLPIGYMLYRYDLEEPPAEWDETYKSIEYKYDTHIPHLKVKNVIGAHFFFENRETAYHTGCIAARKHNKIMDNRDIYTGRSRFIGLDRC